MQLTIVKEKKFKKKQIDYIKMVQDKEKEKEE